MNMKVYLKFFVHLLSRLRRVYKESDETNAAASVHADEEDGGRHEAA